MNCACGDQGKEGMTYCERHAIEYKRRAKKLASDLAMIGEEMREELRLYSTAAGRGPRIIELEQKWLAALRRAKEETGA